jgi:hypothetical protein
MSKDFGIVCPNCGADHGEDGWEVLAENEVHEMMCQTCRAVFFTALFECRACVADNVISSLTQQVCFDRTCGQCGYHPDPAEESNEETYL